MDGSNRYPTESGTRVVATPADDVGRIEQALAQAQGHVARMLPSPGTQQIQRLLQSFRFVMDGWSAAPPTEADVRALRERVELVLQLARTTSPTLRFRRAG